MPALWAAAFGACVGSLINVLAYRLPLGLDVVSPPSKCPSCETYLTWRENIPIFGWLMLRGKCRFCKSHISAQYPIVEATVALIWFVLLGVWFSLPTYGSGPFGLSWQTVRPGWTASGLSSTWPIVLVMLTLISSLVAMTLTDLKSFTIPLVLPWFATLIALIFHPLWALYVQLSAGDLFSLRGTMWPWALATPATLLSEQNLTPSVPGSKVPLTAASSYAWLGAALGGALGVGVSMLMLRFKLISPSFADYEQWEAEQIAASAAAGNAPAETDPTALWTAYPHARREMVRELAYLAPIGLLAIAGAVAASLLANRFCAAGTLPTDYGTTMAVCIMPPLWLNVLGGVALGYLVGGGLVWLVRILGTFAFNKEAMGLGDVHLLAAVGAAMGWIDAILTFFTGAFVGLIWTLAGAVITRGGPRRTLPFGPSLAIAAGLVLLFKPLFELLLGRILHADGAIDLP